MRLECTARATVFLAVLAATPAANAQFDASMQAVARGEYVVALEAAATEPDPLRRVQAVVWTLHSAGDLEGALARARAGLEAAPDDPWLLDQATFIALTLGDAAAVRDGLAGLERVRGAPHAEYEALAAEQGLQRQAIDRSLARARGTVALGALLGLGLLLALARGSRP